jgi:UDP-N-acetyl-2-amino-2-deoxyglucuronate dehydrogenase
VTSLDAEPLCVVIVGGGLISDTHARAVQQVDGARLAGFVGGARSRERAKQFGVAYDADFAALVSSDGPYAAVICTPPGTHAEIGIAAARLGMHVLVEKPVDLSVAAARRLQSACREAGSVLGVVSQRRFDSGFVKLAELIHDRRLGRLTLGSAAMKCWREHGYYEGWQGTRLLGGGGALINQGIHTVDMLCAVMGPPRRVSALERSIAHDIEVEDVALATIEFSSGAVGTIESTTAFFSAASGPTVANVVERLEIAGTKGSAVLNAGQLVHCSIATGDFPAPEALAATKNALPLEPFVQQYRDFVNAVRARREPAVTADDAIRALELISAIYESARTGKPVEIGSCPERP